MPVIIQRKRLLVSNFIDEDKMGEFINKNTITDYDMYFKPTKEWVSLFETTYNGNPVLAIPRRFPANFLNSYLDSNEATKDLFANKSSSRKIKNKYEPRNSEQVDILDFMLGRNEHSKIARQPRRGLFAETGSGKTFITLKCISENKDFTIINCPDEKAIMTWTDEILKFTNIKSVEIGVIRGRASLPKLIKNKKDYKIILCSSKTISSLIASGDYDVIENFVKDMEFSLMVHDEAHLNIQVLFFLEMLSPTKRTYYLTATPGRRIYQENSLLSRLLPAESCIYEQAIDPRFELRICKYYSNPREPDHVKGLNKPRCFDYGAYGRNYLFVKSKPYLADYSENILPKVIRAARKALTDKENKIAIVCKTIAENEAVVEIVQKHFPDLTIGVFNSEIKDMDERFKETNAKIIVSTDKSLAGIVNITGLEAMIFIHPVTSKEHLVQIIGRIRRKEGKRSLVYVMIDASFSRCLKSGRRVKEVLSSFCIDQREIFLNDNFKNKVEIGEI